MKTLRDIKKSTKIMTAMVSVTSIVFPEKGDHDIPIWLINVKLFLTIQHPFKQ